jgi:hypothetical protein
MHTLEKCGKISGSARQSSDKKGLLTATAFYPKFWTIPNNFSGNDQDQAIRPSESDGDDDWRIITSVFNFLMEHGLCDDLTSA